YASRPVREGAGCIFGDAPRLEGWGPWRPGSSLLRSSASLPRSVAPEPGGPHPGVGEPSEGAGWRVVASGEDSKGFCTWNLGGETRARRCAVDTVGVSYDHMLLPSGVAATPAEVDAYFVTQEGRAETPAVAAMAAELNDRNAELPEAD